MSDKRARGMRVSQRSGSSSLALMLWLSIVAWPAALPGQVGEAMPGEGVSTVGRILDQTGKPWAGARIVFLSRLHPICAEESVQRVEVVSDKRGKFRAMLERDRVYLAWGYGSLTKSPTAKSGEAWRLTDITSGVLPGQVLRLTEARVSPQHRLRIEDKRKDKRKEEGRLSAKLITKRPGYAKLDRSDVREGMGFVFPVGLDEKNRTRLPPLPWDELWIEIYDDKGVRIHIEKLPKRSQWSGEETCIKVLGAERKTVHATAVQDVGTVDGLVLYQRIRGELKEVARTLKGDSMDVGLKIMQRDIRRSGPEIAYPDLELGAKGSSRAFLLQMLGGKKARELGANKMTVTLLPGRTLRGKIGRSRCLILQQSPTGRPGAFIATNAPAPVYEMQSREDGSFAFEGMGPGRYRLLTLLTATERRRLCEDSSIEPQALLAIGKLSKDRDLGELDLARLVRVDLSLRYSDGARGAGVRILLMQRQGAETRDGVILRSQSDRKGRRRLLLPVGERFDLLIVSERGHAIAPLDLRQASPSAVLPIEVSIPVGLRIQGQVLDSEGNPGSGTQVCWYIPMGASRTSYFAQHSAQDLFATRPDAEGRFSFVASLQRGALLLWAIKPDGRGYLPTKLKLAGEEIRDLTIQMSNH